MSEFGQSMMSNWASAGSSAADLFAGDGLGVARGNEDAGELEDFVRFAPAFDALEIVETDDEVQLDGGAITLLQPAQRIDRVGLTCAVEFDAAGA